MWLSILSEKSLERLSNISMKRQKRNIFPPEYCSPKMLIPPALGVQRLRCCHGCLRLGRVTGASTSLATWTYVEVWSQGIQRYLEHCVDQWSFTYVALRGYMTHFISEGEAVVMKPQTLKCWDHSGDLMVIEKIFLLKNICTFRSFQASKKVLTSHKKMG